MLRYYAAFFTGVVLWLNLGKDKFSYISSRRAGLGSIHEFNTIFMHNDALRNRLAFISFYYEPDRKYWMQETF